MNRFLLTSSALILGLAIISPVYSNDFYGPKEAKKDFLASNYSKIDKQYTKLLKGNERERLAIYQIVVSLGRFSNEGKLVKWTASKPKSPLGWASLGMACLEEAKTIRKFAPLSKTFKEKIAKAISCTDKAHELSPKDINMSSFQIECAEVGGWGRKK